MPVLIGLGVGAAVGGIKYAAFDAPAQAKKVQLAASTQRYSPWTGMKATAPDPINPMSDVLQYGSTGASLGQGIQSAQDTHQLAGDYNTWLKQGYSPNSMSGVDPTQAKMFAASNGMGPISGLNYNKSGSQFWQQNPWGSGGTGQ